MFFRVSFLASAALLGAATFHAYRCLNRRLDALDDEIALAHKLVGDHAATQRTLITSCDQMARVLNGVNVRSAVTARRVFADRTIAADRFQA